MTSTPAPKRGDTSSSSHLVLIVEDDRDAARDLEQVLDDADCAVTAIAASEAEAVAELTASLPDVVFIDIGLNGAGGGIDIARTLRRRFDVPVVFLVDRTDDALIERARKIDSFGYLVRPVKSVELRSVLELCLYRSGRRPGSRTRIETTTSESGPSRRVTVLLADDHAIVRDGLMSLLTEHNFTVVGAVGDGRMLVEAAIQLRPDVIVTDLSMPGLSGLDVLMRLKAEHVDSKVLVLTMHNDLDLAARATREGASGFLLKHSAGEELVNAIHQVLQGRIYLTPAVTKGVIERLATPGGTPGPQLTQRQLEVLRLIVDGLRMKQIAAALNLSTRTVETHKYELMRALDVHSVAELVRYALTNRLVVDEAPSNLSDEYQ